MLIDCAALKGLSVRYIFAFIVLVFIVSFSPILTVYYNSVQVNNFLAQAQLLFFILVARESIQVMIYFFNDREEFFSASIILGFISVVLISYFFVSSSGRSFVYISNLLFFIGLVYFFFKFESAGILLIEFKIISVVFVSVAFSVFLLLDGDSFYSSVSMNPPVYRNIRHLNYELMVAMAGLVLIYVLGRLRIIWFVPIFLFFSLVAVWSGGRGQLVALVIFLIFIFFSKRYAVSSLSVFLVLAAAFMVFVSGESALLLGQIEDTFESSSFNDVSSGRVAIWRETWDGVLRSGWLGNGADSFRVFEIGPDFIIHPHNSILQFAFEFGFLGLILVVLFFAWTGIWCIRTIFNLKSGVFLKVGASFLLSMYAYSLVDGVFYHGIPLSFMIIFGALLFVEAKKERSGTTFSEASVPRT